MSAMRDQIAGHIEIVNKLRRGTLEGKLLWERTGEVGKQYSVLLDTGYRATVQKTPAASVVLTMVNAQGVASVHLDSSRVPDDVLRLALLQLFVAVRDTMTDLMTKDALDAVRDL
ncbi:MAG: hypothetical protein FJX72_21910 [Armatimonadetes bacterium]|nr:hypothetical protein [Armatimonadota bacterium]